jgi:hypothetical protein
LAVSPAARGRDREANKLALDVGDRDRDDRLVDEHHRHGEHHRRQHEILLLAHRLTSRSVIRAPRASEL